MHKQGIWYPEMEKPDEDDGDSYILCVTWPEGDGHAAYDYGFLMDEYTCFEDGQWYPRGMKKPENMIIYG